MKIMESQEKQDAENLLKFVNPLFSYFPPGRLVDEHVHVPGLAPTLLAVARASIR